MDDTAFEAFKLKDRCRDVLYLLCKGLRNTEIALHLRLSERTVKGYVSQLFLIFDVTNRTELVGSLIGKVRLDEATTTHEAIGRIVEEQSNSHTTLRKRVAAGSQRE